MEFLMGSAGIKRWPPLAFDYQSFGLLSALRLFPVSVVLCDFLSMAARGRSLFPGGYGAALRSPSRWSCRFDPEGSCRTDTRLRGKNIPKDGRSTELPHDSCCVQT